MSSPSLTSKQIIADEVNKKRKLIDLATTSTTPSSNNNGPPPKKYVRRGELEAAQDAQLRKENERKAKEEAEKSKEVERLAKERSRSASPAVAGRPDAIGTTNANTVEEENDSIGLISSDEVIRRLRSRGEPIRLFGETDRQRVNRLRLLESHDADMGSTEAGQKNEFRRAMEQTEQRLVKEALAKQAGMEDEDLKRKQAAEDALLDSVDTSDISIRLLEQDEDRNLYLVSVFFKRMLRDWGRHLDQMPDEEKRSRDGKLRMTTYRQTHEYLQPFFRALKQKTLEPDVLARVTDMASYMQQREYQKANNEYLTMSIGNAPWPIGVTMVGIHERSGREKIFASKVAHVLNDETTRKWIQSLKRMMTWAQVGLIFEGSGCVACTASDQLDLWNPQDVFPPDDISKRMG